MEEKIQVQEPKRRKDFGKFEKLRIQVSERDRKKRWGTQDETGMAGRSTTRTRRLYLGGPATQPLSCQGCLVAEEGKPIKLFNLSPLGHFLQLQMNHTVSFSSSTWPGYQGLEQGLFSRCSLTSAI